MNMVGTVVIYIDAAGVTHEALVFGQNVLNPQLLDLAYVDAKAPVADNLRKVYAIDHHENKKETNPDLPAYPLNAWKESYEEHQVIPPDHPNFDHPFEPKVLGLNGQPIPKERPLTDAFARTHVELSKEDADELKALSGSGGMFGGLTESAKKASGPDAQCAECGEAAVLHTVAAAKGDVGMDHDFVEKLQTPPDPPPVPVTSTEDLQMAIEGITGTEGLPTGTGPKYPMVENAVVPEVVDAPPEDPGSDGGDPPNCQPGQLC